MFPTTLQHILVPVDFSEPSDMALEAAIALARAKGARLTLMHAFLPPTPISELNFDMTDITKAMERDATGQLALRSAKAQEQGVTCVSITKLGTPHLEILGAIEHHAPDLVVMSTHGRTGLKHVVLGSVAERVVQHSRCPVLVMPAPRWHGK